MFFVCFSDKKPKNQYHFIDDIKFEKVILLSVTQK